jgi:hypothetical protein
MPKYVRMFCLQFARPLPMKSLHILCAYLITRVTRLGIFSPKMAYIRTVYALNQNFNQKQTFVRFFIPSLRTRFNPKTLYD